MKGLLLKYLLKERELDNSSKPNEPGNVAEGSWCQWRWWWVRTSRANHKSMWQNFGVLRVKRQKVSLKIGTQCLYLWRVLGSHPTPITWYRNGWSMQHSQWVIRLTGHTATLDKGLLALAGGMAVPLQFPPLVDFQPAISEARPNSVCANTLVFLSALWVRQLLLPLSLSLSFSLSLSLSHCSCDKKRKAGRQKLRE
jgi:hypothetical protein